jgi:hypothetical protein
MAASVVLANLSGKQTLGTYVRPHLPQRVARYGKGERFRPDESAPTESAMQGCATRMLDSLESRVYSRLRFHEVSSSP